VLLPIGESPIVLQCFRNKVLGDIAASDNQISTYPVVFDDWVLDTSDFSSSTINRSDSKVGSGLSRTYIRICSIWGVSNTTALSLEKLAIIEVEACARVCAVQNAQFTIDVHQVGIVFCKKSLSPFYFLFVEIVSFSKSRTHPGFNSDGNKFAFCTMQIVEQTSRARPVCFFPNVTTIVSEGRIYHSFNTFWSTLGENIKIADRLIRIFSIVGIAGLDSVIICDIKSLYQGGHWRSTPDQCFRIF